MEAFARLRAVLRRYRRAFGLGLACVVVTSTVGLTAPWVLKLAIDDLSRGVTRGKLAGYSLLLLAIAAVGGVFRFLMRRILMGASRDIEYDMRNDFFRHLQRMPLAYFQARRTGDLMSRATNDLGAVRMMIGPAVMYTANTLIVFVVGVAMMVSLDPWLTLVALAPMPILSLSVSYFGNRIHRGFERVQARLSDLSAVVQESLSGVRVVRAYRQEPFETERFRRANAEYMAENRALIRLLAFFLPSMTLMLGVGALVVLWMGSLEVIRGRITIGDLVAFNAYLGLLSWPMIGFGWVTNLLERGLASWKRMLEVLDTCPAITDAGAGSAITRPEQIRGRIEFRNLTFGYDGRRVLDGVSVTIEAGRTAAIVGPTGSGKSTLVNLIPRLHEPPPATVFVDGVDVREIPLAVLRGAIGFVPQEPFLFSDTIRENIAFGTGLAGGTAPDGQVRAEDAAAIARLDKDLESFPDGYDTIVGERGITLSGGQKQRTALARAVMVDPRILILDDALSAVDTYTEEEILGRLRGVTRERTSIIISHRVSTVRDADQILVLDRGRIAERGRHEELVAAGGLYAELYRQQQLEEELAAS